MSIDSLVQSQLKGIRLPQESITLVYIEDLFFNSYNIENIQVGSSTVQGRLYLGSRKEDSYFLSQMMKVQCDLY